MVLGYEGLDQGNTASCNHQGGCIIGFRVAWAEGLAELAAQKATPFGERVSVCRRAVPVARRANPGGIGVCGSAAVRARAPCKDK